MRLAFVHTLSPVSSPAFSNAGKVKHLTGLLLVSSASNTSSINSWSKASRDAVLQSGNTQVYTALWILKSRDKDIACSITFLRVVSWPSFSSVLVKVDSVSDMSSMSWHFRSSVATSIASRRSPSAFCKNKNVWDRHSLYEAVGAVASQQKAVCVSTNSKKPYILHPQ